jgi:hypothetical protein
MAPPVFPVLAGLAYPVRRTAVWSTVKHDALSGKKTRFPLWTYPIWRFELPFNFLRSDQINLELQTLAGFINGLLGAATLFAYNDTSTPDNSVTGQLFGTGDGTTLGPFQLCRTFGGFTEPVFLINGVPTIYVAGVPTVPASISAYGGVTFSTAPASGAALTWTGNFYWPCRLDEDTTDYSQMMQLIWELRALKFSSEKLP